MTVGGRRAERSHLPPGRILWSAVGAFFLFTAVLAPIRVITGHDQAEREAAAAAAAAEPGEVTIAGRAFAPGSITVAPGSTVVWTNSDPGSHTVTADDLSFDSGALTSGSSFTAVVTATVTYHCGIHPAMKATIAVEG